MQCDWCELPISDRERPIRLSNSQPPWTLARVRGAAGTIASVANTFSAAMKTVSDRPEVTLWFHETCWDKFHLLLKGETAP